MPATETDENARRRVPKSLGGDVDRGVPRAESRADVRDVCQPDDEPTDRAVSNPPMDSTTASRDLAMSMASAACLLSFSGLWLRGVLLRVLAPAGEKAEADLELPQ